MFYLRCFFALFIFQTILTNTQAQTSSTVHDYNRLIEVIPPAPNAAALGKYGDLNIGLSSGTPNINIPLYSFAVGKLGLPISLSYSSNGLRVDEIASRVGTGWILNCEGVITRTVFGYADEVSQRLPPPPDFPQRSRALIDFMDAASLTNEPGNGNFDVQPDVFSFNVAGNSGKFILDDNLQPIQTMHSGVKIERDFTSTLWNFKITTDDGVQYFFGGNNATDKTKRTQSGAACGKTFSNFIPTAWYINKIVHPNGQTFTFNYTQRGFYYSTGVSQSIYKYDNSQGSSTQCNPTPVAPPVMDNTTCEGLTQSTCSILQQITASDGSTIKFIYIDRSDNADVLLSNISIYQPNQSLPIKVFDFKYQQSYATSFLNSFSTNNNALRYRPFLTSLTEASQDKKTTKKHDFSYNDVNSLPPRLSFAQDDYGYFNGKANTTLIPLPASLSFQQQLPSANADRSTNELFAVKGMLTKIIYPTGGYDEISYESNKEYRTVNTLPPKLTLYNSVNHHSMFGYSTTNSATINISMSQSSQFTGGCQPNGTIEEIDPIRDYATHSLYKNGSLLWTRNIYPNESFDVVINLESGANYYIKSEAFGNVSAGAALSYMAGTITSQNINVNVAGMRVSKVVSTSTPTSVINTKKYYYTKFADPNVSSGKVVYTPMYEKFITVTIPCPNSGQDNGGGVSCSGANFNYYSMYSNSQTNLYAYSNAPITYGNVTEGFGENYEGGKIEHTFSVNSDIYGNNLLGTYILNAPLTSLNYKNGLEQVQSIYKKQNNTFLPVKRIYTSYKEDTRRSIEYKGFVCNKKYSTNCPQNPPNQFELDAYDLYQYSHWLKWVYPDTVTTQTFDNNGTSYIEEKVLTEYGNILHALPTKITTYTSTETPVYIKNYYPQDLSLTGNEESARQLLISKHIISPILQKTITKGNAQTLKLKTNYGIYSNNLPLPSDLNIQIAANSMEKRIQFYSYDNDGNLLEQAKISDSKMSFLYDYSNQYPISEVKNASQSQIAYSSFEADGTGKWAFNNAGIDTTGGFTGTKSFTLSSTNTLTRTGLTSGSYIVTYWKKNSANTVSVNGSPGTSLVSKKGWTLYSRTLSSATSVTITGTATIDEVRLYPVNAQMTTYTYEPLVGMTSQCDAASHLTTYEYDGLGRLSVVRDQDNNIVKKIDYHYNGEPETSPTCDCGNPNLGKRCINGQCQQGIRVNTSTVKVANGFRCTYHWEWPDFPGVDNSGNIIEINADPCFIDQQ